MTENLEVVYARTNHFHPSNEFKKPREKNVVGKKKRKVKEKKSDIVAVSKAQKLMVQKMQLL